ncbi:MAG: DUF192 domain-containing protein [Candidatus Omnitrophota bacterium]
MPIYNKTQQTLLASKVFFADHFLKRAIGLLGRKSLAPGEALIIPYCQAIHMFFMQFSIDVVFVSKTYQVVGLVPNIKPFYLSPFFLKAFFAIELEEGVIEKTKIKKGDFLDFGSINKV